MNPEVRVRGISRDTMILEAGYRRDAGVIMPGPQFSGTYTAPGEPAQNTLTYGRFQNPTWTALEEALGVVDGGLAVSFASGMAAVQAILGTVLRPGDTLVLPADCYYTVRLIAKNHLEPLGIRSRMAPTRGNAQAGILDGARLLWLETPTNPELDVCDIRELCRAAHAVGALVAVDNTTATGYLQDALALGADFVVCSDTKSVAGHSDVVLGHVSVRDPQRVETLRLWRTQHGAIPGPMEAWIAHRSIATLPLRLTRQCDSALQLATALVDNRRVRDVRYPGLSTHPGYQIARQQMRGFGPVVSFELASRDRAEKFLRSLQLVREATSFGGLHSTAERRARWGGDAIGEGFIRFSVGCEAPEDIIADVEHALRAAE